MKKLCGLLIAVLVVCLCWSSVFAESGTDIGLELKKDKLDVYAIDDPLVSGYLKDVIEEEGVLTEAVNPELAGIEEVIILPLKGSRKIKVSVTPKSVKNKKVEISVPEDAEEIVKVKGDSITGAGLGETVLTITSMEDPAVSIKYRVLVIKPVKKITVAASNKNVNIGGKIELTAGFSPEDATIQNVVWKSANEKLATVDENGIVTGVKRGEVKITATAKDGSGAKGSVTVKVVQPAESITLNKTDFSLDVWKRTSIKATVMPRNTDNKRVEWSSTDESVAKVDKEGRVTAVKKGSCEIICASKTDGSVQARAAVNVLQPVKKIIFGEVPDVYVDETGTLTWTIEPAEASNPNVKLKSSNEKILKVDENGTITGVKGGEVYVTATAVDGSQVKAKVKVKVMQHIKSVKMRRKTAYINLNESETVSAQFDPNKYINTNMTWKINKPAIARITPETKNSSRVKLTGLKEGTAKLTGTTEDGGLTASMNVRVGNWNNVLKIADAYIDSNGFVKVIVQNNSEDLNITSITIEIEAFTSYGDPVEINSKDMGNVIEATYNHAIKPGESTPKNEWQFKNYNNQLGFKRMIVRVTKYQIDNDWVMEIKDRYQPSYTYKK